MTTNKELTIERKMIFFTSFYSCAFLKQKKLDMKVQFNTRKTLQ